MAICKPDPGSVSHASLPDDATADLRQPEGVPAALPSSLVPGGPVGPEYAAIDLPGFTIISVLGYGGMGVVFLARQERLQRLVALKMLSAETARDADYIHHLEREARTLATLNHPNIVGCHDIVSSPRQTFLVMQFVPGQLSVHDLLIRFRVLPEPIVARIALDTAKGLAYACEKGICHRDVKPHNLLVYYEGASPPLTPYEVFTSPNSRAMICDFGIARELVPRAGVGPAILGSPAYVAPEQAFDRPHVDFRADVYALGCTLYQLLTGKRPFRGGTSQEIIAQKRDHDLPDPRQDGALVTEECAHILRRMGAAAPERRYGTYSELLDDIQRWVSMHHALPRSSILGRYPPAFWRGVRYGVGAVLAALLAVGLVVGRHRMRPVPVSMTATLGFWQGERAAWRVWPPDAEYRRPSLVGLPSASELELRHRLRPGTRLRMKIRIMGQGSTRCVLRHDDQDACAFHWSRRHGVSQFTVRAHGRTLPLVEIPQRQPMAWLQLDLRFHDRQIDIFVDGKARGIAPLETDPAELALFLAVTEGSPVQYADIWITTLP